MTAAAALVAVAAALAPHGLSYAGRTPWNTTHQRAWGEDGSRRLTAEAGPARLRAASEPAANEEAGRRLLAEWSARLSNQFDGEMSYPGIITRRYEVPAALRPRAVMEAAGRSVWITPATERLTFGVGSSDLVKFMAVVSHRWCPAAGRAVEVSLFYPRAEFSEKAALREESAFSCLQYRER